MSISVCVDMIAYIPILNQVLELWTAFLLTLLANGHDECRWQQHESSASLPEREVEHSLKHNITIPSSE